MIESVGYTDNGEVWLTFSAMLEGRVVKATMTLEADNALNASKSLAESAEKALKIRSVGDVGNGPNLGKGGVKGD